MNNLLLALMVRIQALAARQDGQDLVEYSLVIALVAFGATSALKTLGGGLNHAFSQINSTLSSSLT
jgi:pilus assembly protein Flp/PilA